MFTKIFFSFDEQGRHLEQDRILSAKDCNAKGFELDTTYARGHRQDAPWVVIRRIVGKLSLDPWNEDGSPPTVMLRLALAHVQLLSGCAFVEGLEEPNMSWAGLIRPPYDEDIQRKPGVEYMTDEMVADKKIRSYDQLLRQRITLVP